MGLGVGHAKRAQDGCARAEVSDARLQQGSTNEGCDIQSLGVSAFLRANIEGAEDSAAHKNMQAAIYSHGASEKLHFVGDGV